jgi:Ca2+/H+ antiporter
MSTLTGRRLRHRGALFESNSARQVHTNIIIIIIIIILAGRAASRGDLVSARFSLTIAVVSSVVFGARTVFSVRSSHSSVK